ncbi:TIGR00725 family protein [Pseudovibrio exalbescens]|uniref:Lysine decarboxylase n=1 Tax=Pseudovibrio exalbescens TaxID=197461 RepID=A0A1U7JFD2_9HYPH|nr:TIGR00725 family protein [Pseudovibrio exalbescens]OKL43351.1 hypothetical protein A3843_14085 [Pseudovibrio exalbescens]
MPIPQLFVTKNNVFSLHGQLDPWTWTWRPADLPKEAIQANAQEALRVLKNASNRRKLPVGVIGPRDATDDQLSTAQEIGARLADLGITMICGGKTGVMTAAAKGCFEQGGLTVGLIPDHEWQAANPYIALPIATGLSEARNMIIAKSCEVLIAIGGSYGTLTEIAYGLHFSKPVIGLCGATPVAGLQTADSASDAITLMADHLFARAQAS